MKDQHQKTNELKHYDIIVVGDGLIGKLTALEFLQQGYSVLQLGKRELRGQASWAAGGIVSPLFPWQYDAALNELVIWSQRLYGSLCEQLQQQTNVNCEYIKSGLLLLDPFDEEDIAGWSQQFGESVESLSHDQVRDRESILNSDYRNAYLLPNVHQVRSPNLLKALTLRLFQFFDYQYYLSKDDVSIFPKRTGQVEVLVDGERCWGDNIIICAGAWSAEILKTLNYELPVQPVKGQMLLLKNNIGLKSIVIKEGKYLIPRQDGLLLVGSTTEEGQSESYTSVEAACQLKQAAEDIVPQLKDEPILQQWAGVRPGAPGGLPFIDKLPDHEGIWVNTGHYRNGITLGPASARLMLNRVTKHKAPAFADAFSFNRPEPQPAMI